MVNIAHLHTQTHTNMHCKHTYVNAKMHAHTKTRMLTSLNAHTQTQTHTNHTACYQDQMLNFKILLTSTIYVNESKLHSLS